MPSAWFIHLAESGRLPDALVRRGIRWAHRRTLSKLERQDARLDAFLDAMRAGPVAPRPEAANLQHYEAPVALFEAMLGPWRKYSACLWTPEVRDLAQAEEAMLDLVCRRAGVEDGMDVLELGCGWGSLCRYILRRFPRCRVLAVSNSRLQREHILAREEASPGLLEGRLEVRTADMNDFDPGRPFHRILSVEMFEHMRNWPELLRRMAGWLRPEGRAFVHVFAHARHAYLFDPAGWMGRHFFMEGMMPSADLLPRCQENMAVERQWTVDGLHYQKTLEAWLANLDAHADAALKALREAEANSGRNADDAVRQLRRWRIFLMACAELFGFDGGRQWHVAQYLLAPRAGDSQGGAA